MPSSKFARCVPGAWLIILCAQTTWAQTDARPTAGIREKEPSLQALQHARLVEPGRVVEDATIVIRDGAITSVVAGGEPPAGARVWDLSEKTVYPGLIDAFAETSVGDPDSGAPYWNELVTPQRRAADHYEINSSTHKKLRGQGITARLVAPSGGVWKGSSAVVTTGDDPRRVAMLRGDAAQHLRLTVSRRRESYPDSPMGAVALARQALYDARWYRQARSAYEADPSLPRPAQNDALEVLKTYPESRELVIVDAANELFFLRADRFAREFGLHIAVRGSGHEYKRLDAIRQARRTVIVPVDFPKPPNVGSIEAALNVRLDTLMHWDLAPENAARLEQAGVPIALTTYGLDDSGDFLKQVRLAVERGLSPDGALRALTTTPASLYGVQHVIGSVAPGKLANLVVTDGDLFDPSTRILETWVQGARYEVRAEPELDLRGLWQLKIEQQDGAVRTLFLRLQGKPKQLRGTIAGQRPDAEDHQPVKLQHVGHRDARFSCAFAAKDFGREGIARLTGVVTRAGDEQVWTGHVLWPDGSREALTARRDEANEDETNEDHQEAGEEEDEDQGEAPRAAQASFAVNYPLGAFGRSERPAPQTVLIRNATIWTCGPAGTLENASILFSDGKIVAVGPQVDAPEGAVVIDAAGKHVTPGIIDCHSHMATDGGVNEGTQAITAEVRIGDFIDADDINIYRQLAGGVTTSNILHGSANPIGGQNQVIKLRWGALPEAIKFDAAPAGIKFALGENVKQSNWGDDHTTRYPQTRMGVEQIIRDALQAAREYRARWRDWETNHKGLPPRRDLELEALAEIVEGKRWIHCHSYRQDEILALMRTLEDFGVQIGTFQHILEGYKVADAMAEHGAMGSAFSDWWAYKFEVYDAIPYAGALMHNAGVVVSFNSDDRELARHLNQEAAKATKYGGVPPVEALKFVTLNPARQLRIDDYVGSLEPGKHADLVIWSGPPMSNYSRCEQTWIDGARYFDLEEDRRARQQARDMRNQLVQKILASGQAMKSADESDRPDDELWPREDIFCVGHDHGHDFSLRFFRNRHHQHETHQE